MAEPLYRKVALHRLSPSQQLDRLLQVTRPQGWLALAALGVLLLAAVLWAFLGTIPTHVQGRAVLMRMGGVRSVLAPGAGSITDRRAHGGDVVAEGQPILSVLRDDALGANGATPVLSPAAGRILEMRVKDGSQVAKGTVLFLLEPLDQPVAALLYLPAGLGARVQPGMKVEISPAGVSRDEYGYLLGTVHWVGRFPVSREGMMRYLENEELARSLAAEGPCVQVMADLLPDTGTPTGYRWSSSNGPAEELYTGTPCQVRITVDERRPVDMVVPALRGGRGS